MASGGRNPMKSNSDHEAILISLLSDLPGLVAIYLHGSAVRGELRPDSDIDVALLFHHTVRPSKWRLLQLAGEAESRLGRPVDIGILTRNNLIYVREVLARGRVVFSTDESYRGEFEMLTHSFYADYRERIKMIRDAYVI